VGKDDNDVKNVIILCPDYDDLLFEDGVGCGDEEDIFIGEEETEIHIDVPGLSEWHSKYIDECLLPCAVGKITLDELNAKFDWKTFHEEGLRLAAEVKKQLPEDVDLLYDVPFEDKSQFIKKPVFIR
jgi:hypothetical protein